MTITEKKQKELEAQGTAASVLASGLFRLELLRAQGSASPIPITDLRLASALTRGSSSAAICLEVSTVDVMRELHRVYDRLKESQSELDADARVVLYASLWDLYE